MRARAIAAPIFFALVGCGPDLMRADGRLELRISQIEDDATTLVVQVTVPEGTSPYRATPPWSGSTLTHVVETVPAGSAAVEVTALQGDAVEQRWASDVTIVADQVTEVRVRLGEGADAGPRVTSAPIDLSIGPLTGADVSRGTLAGTATLPTAAVARFLDEARAQLGAEPSVVELSSARVAIRDPEAEGVDDVDEAWRGVLRLTSDAGATVLASTTVPEDVITVSLEPTATNATPLWRAAATTATALTLEGDARRDATDDFRAEVVLTLVLSAR